MRNVLFQKTRETSISRGRSKLTLLNVTEKSSMLETNSYSLSSSRQKALVALVKQFGWSGGDESLPGVFSLEKR